MNGSLLNKLRYSSEMRALLLSVPSQELKDELGIQGAAEVYDEAAAGSYDFVILFAESIADLKDKGDEAVQAVKRDGLLWICYPKATTMVRTDLTRERGWRTITDEGFEAVALVPIGDSWSAMQFRSTAKEAKQSKPRKQEAVKPASQEASAVPEDLAAALAKSPQAAAFFESLTASRKQAYLVWVTGAKHEETRRGRVAETIEKLAKGNKTPYERG
ncbi:YdeI/OmpD-associated family protein [Paenibacillus sp. GCM10023252]|uniref:YdeI/OmpD-associated family protein n=1 Tax=Paenibacillus sp. GCM10023252 TaxID=3252649 RepID=UPI00360B04C3